MSPYTPRSLRMGILLGLVGICMAAGTVARHLGDRSAPSTPPRWHAQCVHVDRLVRYDARLLSPADRHMLKRCVEEGVIHAPE